MLQTSRTLFTQHNQDRVAAAILVIYDIPHLSLLSIGTAIALFNLQLSCSNLWDTGDLARPHRAESKKSG
jgi:hypothetical protein